MGDVPGIVLAFGPARFEFLFLSSQWQELQRVLGLGPWEVELRLIGGKCTERELRETIRIGLWGGGLSVAEALDLSGSYVGAKPGDLGPARLTAISAISYSLHGLDDELSGESPPPVDGKTQPSPRRTAKSRGAKSSKPPGQSA